VIDNIAKILRKKDIMTQFSRLGKIKQGMRLAKYNFDRHQLKGVYKINCSCGKSYIGEIGCSLQTRLKEHGANIMNGRSCTSALAEHSSKTKHHVYLENTSIFAREEQHHRQKIREAFEIIKHPQNLNKDNGIKISRSRLPLIKEIKTTNISQE